MKNSPTSASLVYTGPGGQSRGDNSGGAAVLPVWQTPAAIARMKAGFDLGKQNAILARQQAVKDAEKKEKNAKALMDAMDKLRETPLWDRTNDELASKLDEQVGQLAKHSLEDEDYTAPNSNTQRALEKFKRDNALWSQKNKDAKKFVDGWIEEMGKPDAQDKYDVEYFAKKMEELSAIEDKEGATEAVYKWTTDPKNNPIVLNADFNKLAESITPEHNKYGAIDKKTVEDNYDLYFGTPEGLRDLDSLKKRGYGNTNEEVKANMVDHVLKNNPNKRVPSEPKSSSNSDSDSSSKKAKRYVVGWNKDNSKPITVSFLHTNSDPLRVDLRGNDGVLRGYSLVSADFNEVTQRWEVTAEKPEGGQWVREVITNFDGSPESKDTHNYEALSEIMGGDFVELVYEQQKQGGGAKPSGNTASPKTNITYNEWKKSNPNGTFSQYKAANK